MIDCSLLLLLLDSAGGTEPLSSSGSDASSSGRQRHHCWGLGWAESVQWASFLSTWAKVTDRRVKETLKFLEMLTHRAK